MSQFNFLALSIQNSFAPNDPRKRFEFLQCLEQKGCRYPIKILTHSTGNNAGNIHFTWRVAATEPLRRALTGVEAPLNDGTRRSSDNY